AGRWLRAALEVIADIGGRGRPAIVVGGSGLYLKVLANGLAPIPEVPPPVRRETGGLFDRLGEAAFRARLAKVDALAEAAIAHGDRQRLTRALEVFLATGRALSEWKEETAPAFSDDALRAVALAPERSELVRRCEARVEAMIAAGALEEVRRLLSRRLDPELPAMKALSLRVFAAHLSGEISLAEAIVRAKAETRRFAKRQTTWLRHQAPSWPRIDPARADLLSTALDHLKGES
ncbi:MAG: tRNA (adenosine(37)-N6)-dimethylallyltransferase MiaA, partial [Caulobacteraceae bacterium]